MVSAALLKQYEFCTGMTDEHLEDLASIATEETHHADTMIYKIGEPATKFYFVVKGKVAMVMETYMDPHRPPMQVNVDFLSKGEVMGWSALIEPHIYTLGGLCVGETEVIAFDAESLRKMINDDCAMGLKVMRATAKIIATRLQHFRILMVGERRLSTLSEDSNEKWQPRHRGYY